MAIETEPPQGPGKLPGENQSAGWGDDELSPEDKQALEAARLLAKDLSPDPGVVAGETALFRIHAEELSQKDDSESGLEP